MSSDRKIIIVYGILVFGASMLGSVFFRQYFASIGDPDGRSISAGLFGATVAMGCAIHFFWKHVIRKMFHSPTRKK